MLHVQINETPYEYPFMHKKHVQINESLLIKSQVFFEENFKNSI